jgi:hypothetical protein
MFYFVTDIVMCVCWGLLISLILTGGLFYLPKLLVARYRYTPLHIALLAIVFCFLLYFSGIRASKDFYRSFHTAWPDDENVGFPTNLGCGWLLRWYKLHNLYQRESIIK